MNGNRIIAATTAFVFCTTLTGDHVLPGGISDFVIVDTTVVPELPYLARFDVLGAEITAGGRYDVPVTVQINIGPESLNPFGSFDSPTGGNVNDGEEGRHLELDQEVLAYVPFSVEAKSWLLRNHQDGDVDGDWYEYLHVSSDSNSSNVLVLRNGDPVPNIDPFMEQEDIGELVKDFVDPRTGLIRLYDDEVIFLFELGTTDLDSPAADFQDLVILVTVAEDADRFDVFRLPPLQIYD